VTVITHGCRSNLAEADMLARWTPEGVTLVNSCAVTAEAVADARKAAKRASRGGGRVWVTGCASAIAPERFSDLDVRLVEKPRIAATATRRSRGFVAIQDGCDHGCTFCVTRLARGPARSAAVTSVVEAVRTLVHQSVAEVVLTGVDSTSWGADLGPGLRLSHLVARVLTDVPALRRLRLSTLDPAEVDDDLIELFAEPRLMPHVHLSLQSGDALILKRMRRRHGPQEAARLVARLKAVRPDMAIGADLIAGFPTEGKAAHRQSLAALEDCDIVHAHVFPYSPRPGTAAARMPQLSPAVARTRAAALRAAAAARKQHWLSTLAGASQETVSEGMKGLTPGFAEVHYTSPRPRGAIVPVTPRLTSDGILAE
jgi:threonylcarbamoyladenosine tRNA methylthiotransferase MtaB